MPPPKDPFKREEWIQRISATKRKQWEDPEFRKARSLERKGKILSQSHKDAISAGVKGTRWANSKNKWLTYNGYVVVHKDGLSPEARKAAELFYGIDEYRYLEHRIIALMKYGPEKLSEPGIVVRHIDGNKINNDPTNLELGTQKENVMDHLRANREVKMWRSMTFSLLERLISVGILSTNDEFNDPAYFGAAV